MSVKVIDEFAFLADACAAHLALSGEAEAETVFATEEEIQAVNAQQRGVDAPTDVLSFPSLSLTAGTYEPFTAQNFPHEVDPENGRVFLGSILICESVAKKQAEEYGHSERRERGYLFLHGLLHLLGYDHMEEADKRVMRAAEEAILQRAGLLRE
ncbi:MAG: rRNA maturation RNase YbeY [Clostridiales bacterium]|nr:rRNA maturation RNase YbeY [Clostridiales bacterium]